MGSDKPSRCAGYGCGIRGFGGARARERRRWLTRLERFVQDAPAGCEVAELVRTALVFGEGSPGEEFRTRMWEQEKERLKLMNRRVQGCRWDGRRAGDRGMYQSGSPRSRTFSRYGAPSSTLLKRLAMGSSQNRNADLPQRRNRSGA
jgi:hypothetical protein